MKNLSRTEPGEVPMLSRVETESLLLVRVESPNVLTDTSGVSLGLTAVYPGTGSRL